MGPEAGAGTTVALRDGGLCRSRPNHPMSSATPSATGPPADGEEPPAAPELPTPSRTWTGLDRLGLDRLGLTQAIGGLALGLITLYSSYDHITLNGRTFPIPQQWGITFIVASVAIFFTGRVQYGAPLGRDAQLASRSRLRAEQAAARMADEANRRENEADRERYFARRERDRTVEERKRADRERQRADRERQRANRERNRAAQARDRQGESLERLHQAAVLSARVQLNPSDTNRARLQTFLPS